MRTKIIFAAAAVGAALLPIAAGSAASAETISVPTVPAGITPAAMMPAGTGEPIAALNAISADGTIAVGTDSINTFLNPLCGTDLGEHRTASGWAAQRTPSPACGWLASVVVLPHHKAWAVGYKMTKTAAILSLTEFYNGSRWQIEPSPNPGTSNYLRSVAVTKSGSVWAVGSNTTGPIILKRSGSRWVQVHVPIQTDLQSITVTPAGQVWAVGIKADPVTFGIDTAILHLTASGWTEVPSPSPGGPNGSYLTTVTSGPHGALWAVGWYFDPVNFEPHTLTLRYSADRWAQVGSPSPGNSADWLYSAAVSSSGQVWAVGGYAGPNCEHNLVEHFAGGSWHVVSVPNRGTCANDDTNALYGVAVAGGNVYTVGQAGIDSLAEVAGSGGHWKFLRSSN
jgi:hypothetical protein